MFCFLFFLLFFSLGLVFFVLSFYINFYSCFVLDVFVPVVFQEDLKLSFNFDFVSLYFFSVICFISSIVFIYSKYYFDSEFVLLNYFVRFIGVLFLFVLSMFFLVFSYSWFLIMLGWDGLGVVSFLLVIFYNDSKSLDSGLVTVFTNRLGDCFFLLSFMIMWYSGFFSFFYLFDSVFFFCLIVILGCMTKSAQFPFSSWLPAAMAAPTPVSSLVHSSTLVTAGVYLLIRFNFLLISGFWFLSIFSFLTMFFGGFFACWESDFKKIVAMSTLSQLGFMIFSLCSNFWLICFFHMLFHAFFKSILFLSTGGLMHLLLGNQDSRFFGSFSFSFYSKLFFLMSCLSLSGFPFSLGFYSKDFLLGGLMYFNGGFSCSVFILSCVFTVCYSLRLMSLSFLSFVKQDFIVSMEEKKIFFFPLIFIFFFNVFCGNFFFFNFLFLNYLFSFWDFFVGMLIICLGGVLYKIFDLNYFFYFGVLMMLFLSSLVSKISFFSYKFYFFKDELTWGEVFGVNGLKIFALKVNETNLNFFKLEFFFLGSMLFLVYFFMFYVFNF